MNPRILAAGLAILASNAAFAGRQEIRIDRPLSVTSSTQIAPGKYLVGDAGRGVVRIDADDVTVDFRGATLRSHEDVWHDLESFEGSGILIDGHKNVTIKNANVQGFRWNVRLVNCENVRLENCDLGLSRSIRMAKDGKEIDTFLNLRDTNAWKGYGAGVWMENCHACTVTKCRATGAQNGILMVDSSANTVHDNDLSFNSGWGICLGRSSDNVISWNHIDFVNRLWGGGWGGDSAAVGAADDSDRNFFVGLSMTHSGDGFFLSNLNDVGYNEKTKLFEPKHGSDNNVIAYCDGSWSTANAFEGTFSQGNVYLSNQANASNYGFWLGFSGDSLLADNTIDHNLNDGIAIEHGKGNKFEGNRIRGNRGVAIHLWASPEEARRNYPSTAIDIVDNAIADSNWAYMLNGSTDVLLRNNTVTGIRQPAEVASATRQPVSGKSAFEKAPAYKKLQQILATKPSGWQMYAESGGPRGVQWLQADDYAPRDFRGDLAAVRNVDPGSIEMYLLQTGVKITAPDWVGFDPTPEDPRLVRISVRPSGEIGTLKPYKVVLVSGDGTRKQVIQGTLQTTVWDAKWFSWAGMTYDDATAWKRLFASKPITAESTRLLGGDYTGRSPAPGVPSGHFALLATTKFQVPEGRYQFRTVSDDGIRVFLDGKEIISRWNHHGPTPDEVTVSLDPGPHSLRVEYCQEDGAAVLRLSWAKVG